MKKVFSSRTLLLCFIQTLFIATEGLVNDTRGGVDEASRRCGRCPFLSDCDWSPALIKLGGLRTAEFGSATHGSWCRAVSPAKLVGVVSGASSFRFHDGPVVRAAS